MKIVVLLALLIASVSSVFARKIEAQLIGVPHKSDVPQEITSVMNGVDWMRIPSMTLENGQTAEFKVDGTDGGRIHLTFTKNDSGVHGTVHIATPYHPNGLYITNQGFATVSTEDCTIPLGSYLSTRKVPIKIFGLRLGSWPKTEKWDAYLRLKFR